MPLSTLNFIWVGEPQGVGDIIGPVTIALNLKKFSRNHSQGNPIVYWCQLAYADYYERFFKERNLDIQVNGIESYLAESSHQYAETVFAYYLDLVADHRNKILDRVNFKDMFAHFILAAQGNYVLDTNVQTDLDKPVVFPAYGYSVFPEVRSHEKAIMTEMWLLYCPPTNLERANKTLDCYLRLYAHFIYKPSLEDPSYLYSELHHVREGEITITALCHLTLEDLENTPHDEFDYRDWCAKDMKLQKMQIWKTMKHNRTGEFYIPELHVMKEYANTHKYQAQYRYGLYFKYISFRELGLPKLKFALEYGLDPNLEANPRLEGRGYQAKRITLLNYVLQECVRENLGYQRAVQLQQVDNLSYQRRLTNAGSLISMLKLLLSKGADPNRVYEISYDRYQLIACTEEISIENILNNRSPVIYVFNFGEKLAYIVFEGQEAYNICGQLNHPLSGISSIAATNKSLTDSRINRKKDKIMGSIIENGHAYPGQLKQEAPLTYAIRSQSEMILDILFKYSRQPININQVLNGRAMFELANKYGMSDALLKQSLKQQHKLSSFSVFNKNSSKGTKNEESNKTDIGFNSLT